MRPALFLALLLLPGAARAAFVVGLLEPVTPRVAARAASLGLASAAVAPRGADGESAGEIRVDDWTRLRFLTARALARSREGVFFRLPGSPAGRDILDYPEEWQALSRVARELRAVRPVLDEGAPAAAPFSVPGVEARAWSRSGRLYVLLVNVSGGPVPLDGAALSSWRALFEARSAPAENLLPCAAGLCLPAEGVLWLEGRLLSGLP